MKNNWWEGVKEKSKLGINSLLIRQNLSSLRIFFFHSPIIEEGK